MDEVRNELLPKLSNAVELMMAPATPQAQRYEAYQACEEFKEGSPYCAQFGILMSDKSNSHIIRHFGLQLLEHSVKYKWNHMSAEDKCLIKDNTIKLMAEGTFDLLEEQTHIKDGLSRIMVEMIKREWPQQYPTMLMEFDKLCVLGPTQTELVLLIFLRLAEDVLLFQTVPNQRRREIMTGLTMNMGAIFNFFVNTLRGSYETYTSSITNGDSLNSQRQCKVAQATLETLSAYVDWIGSNYIFSENGMLLCLLCVMISDVNLQLPAAECLLIIANRRGKPEDRKHLLVLFSTEAMTALLNAARAAGTADLEEHHYLFLKKLCQVLTAIGTQLVALWGLTIDKETIEQPATFSEYLEAILAFTQHPSQFLGSITQSLWASLLRHEHIKHNAVFKDTYLPKLIATTKQTLRKVGFPSQSNSPSCAYAAQDFDSDEDFFIFYSKYRAEVVETIRLCTQITPLVTFQFLENWLLNTLKCPIETGKDLDNNICNQSSPSFLEWDALSVYMESVMSRLERAEGEKPPSESGLTLLQALLAFHTRDPLIYSCVLSCVSALISYLVYAPHILSTILDKIFAAAVFTLEGQTKSTRSRAVRNVRLHACSVLIKICKQYPHLVFPGLDTLYTHIKKLSQDPDELSQLEKTTLLEALILISNEHKNFNKQTEFVAEILAPVRNMWLSQEVREALWSAEKFISYVGLDQAPVEPSSADTCGINRSHLLYCVNVIFGVMKRCEWPSSPEQAVAGGFVLCTDSAGKVHYKNPATQHILQFMENLLALVRTMNQTWLPENIARRHPEFGKAYDLMETEKQIILGIHPPCVDNSDCTINRQPLERMQSFITNFHDHCYHILGNAGQALGTEFYQAPQLAQSIANSVFTNLDQIPEYRLKIVIRAFLKPFAMHCPKDFYGSVLVPLLECICPYMLQRLSSKWTSACKDINSGESEDRDPESEEVLHEQLLRLITREYFEFIATLLKEKKEAKEDDMDEDAQASAPSSELVFSDLGKNILQTQNLYPSIVITIFNGLTWPDTATCNKSIKFCLPVVKELVLAGHMTNDDACHVYMQILQGLQLQGQHEGQQAMLLSLGLQVYEFLRPKFPDVQLVMLQIPGITQEALKAFDEKILNTSPGKQLPEKRKKEHYKKLVSEIIGKNVGQQFKKEAKIQNLPPILKATRAKNAALLESSQARELGICSLFARDDDD